MTRAGRRVRGVLNPVSTRLAELWCTSAVRRTLLRALLRAQERRASPLTGGPADPGRSPGPWSAPPGVLPGWDWLPPDHGVRRRLDRVPAWVRLWYRTPFVDRYAHAWMWHHGGWDVLPTAGPGDPAGDREPRRPPPRSPAGRR
ncbi:hypothetical protein [Modestobacter sp. SYSU DS0290]